MRKLVLLLALLGATIGPAAAAAAVTPPPMTCGPTCDPGGGYTGCKTVQASHSSSVWLVYSVSHVFRVSYCKVNGVITSISDVRNYCDVGGLVSCTPTVWFPTGGGVGSTWATFEAHAVWSVTALKIYNSTDVLSLLIPTIDG